MHVTHRLPPPPTIIGICRLTRGAFIRPRRFHLLPALADLAQVGPGGAINIFDHGVHVDPVAGCVQRRRHHALGAGRGVRRPGDMGSAWGACICGVASGAQAGKRGVGNHPGEKKQKNGYFSHISRTFLSPHPHTARAGCCSRRGDHADPALVGCLASDAVTNLAL